MKEFLEKYLITIDKLGGDSRRLIFKNPANETYILEIENKLSNKLPDDFRSILLTVSSHCEFKWFLPDNFPLPDQLRQIFLRRCWYEALILKPCLPTTDAALTSVVGTPYTRFDAYQQRHKQP